MTQKKPKISVPCGLNEHLRCRGRTDREYVPAGTGLPDDYGKTFICECACHQIPTNPEVGE